MKINNRLENNLDIKDIGSGIGVYICTFNEMGRIFKDPDLDLWKYFVGSEIESERYIVTSFGMGKVLEKADIDPVKKFGVMCRANKVFVDKHMSDKKTESNGFVIYHAKNDDMELECIDFNQYADITNDLGDGGNIHQSLEGNEVLEETYLVNKNGLNMVIDEDFNRYRKNLGDNASKALKKARQQFIDIRLNNYNKKKKKKFFGMEV